MAIWRNSCSLKIIRKSDESVGLMLTETFWLYTGFLSLKHFFSEELDANTRFATSIALSHFPVSQYEISLSAVLILEGGTYVSVYD